MIVRYEPSPVARGGLGRLLLACRKEGRLVHAGSLGTGFSEADEDLAGLNERFETLYSRMGRPSIPPETLLRATLLQAFFSVRSERMLMEQIDYNLLFRWFVGLEMDAAVWHPTVFTHNRDRLVEAGVAHAFLSGLMDLRQVKRLLSSDQFSVDGTLIDAWASMKSFRPKDGSGEPPGPGRNGERDLQKEKRSNETHASTTDPDARLYRKAAGRLAVEPAVRLRARTDGYATARSQSCLRH